MHFVLSPFSLIQPTILEVKLSPAVSLSVDFVSFVAASFVELLHAILLKWMFLLGMFMFVYLDSAV